MAIYKLIVQTQEEEFISYCECDKQLDYRDAKNVVQTLVEKTKRDWKYLDFNHLESLLAKSGFTAINTIEVEVKA